jgi:ribosome-binding protein aMBF1 (putative translation factor)
MQCFVCPTFVGEQSFCGGVAEDDRKARSNEVAQRFGDNLRRIRRRKGLSQDELAARASLHRTEIGLLENGQRVARITTMIQLAGAMDVDPTELIAGINWSPGGVLGGSFGFQDPAPRRNRRDSGDEN